MRERLDIEDGLDPTDADGTLVRFLTREEELFRALEKIVVEARLEEGFSSVDGSSPKISVDFLQEEPPLAPHAEYLLL